MLKFMFELRAEPQTLKKLISIWPNPETRKRGVTAYAVSKATGLSQQTMLNYTESTPEDFNPRWVQMKILEEFFDGIIVFCVDSKKTIDNEKALKKLEDFLNDYVYKKSSK